MRGGDVNSLFIIGTVVGIYTWDVKQFSEETHAFRWRFSPVKEVEEILPQHNWCFQHRYLVLTFVSLVALLSAGLMIYATYLNCSTPHYLWSKSSISHWRFCEVDFAETTTSVEADPFDVKQKVVNSCEDVFGPLRFHGKSNDKSQERVLAWWFLVIHCFLHVFCADDFWKVYWVWLGYPQVQTVTHHHCSITTQSRWNDQQTETFIECVTKSTRQFFMKWPPTTGFDTYVMPCETGLVTKLFQDFGFQPTLRFCVGLWWCCEVPQFLSWIADKDPFDLRY